MTILYLIIILVFMILWWLSKEMKIAIRNQKDSKRNLNQQLSSETSNEGHLLDKEKQTPQQLRKQASSSKGRLINIVMEEGKIVERTYRKNNGSTYKVRS